MEKARPYGKSLEWMEPRYAIERSRGRMRAHAYFSGCSARSRSNGCSDPSDLRRAGFTCVGQKPDRVIDCGRLDPAATFDRNRSAAASAVQVAHTPAPKPIRQPGSGP